MTVVVGVTVGVGVTVVVGVTGVVVMTVVAVFVQARRRPVTALGQDDHGRKIRTNRCPL